MFCGPPKFRDFKRHVSDADYFSALFLLGTVIACVVLFVILATSCVDDDGDACEPMPHLDTTGNTVVCDCDCDGADACPLVADGSRSRVPDCWESDT